MLKSHVFVRALLGTGIVALMVLTFGVFMYIESSRRADALNKLISRSTDSAETLSELRATETQKAQSLVFMGGGVVLVGVTALMYTRISDEA